MCCVVRLGSVADASSRNALRIEHGTRVRSASEAAHKSSLVFVLKFIWQIIREKVVALPQQDFFVDFVSFGVNFGKESSETSKIDYFPSAITSDEGCCARSVRFSAWVGHHWNMTFCRSRGYLLSYFTLMLKYSSILFCHFFASVRSVEMLSSIPRARNVKTPALQEYLFLEISQVFKHFV